MDVRSISLWTGLAAALTGAPQSPVFRPGPDVTAPFVAAKAPPAYSDEARLAKLEGSVLLSLVVGADGQPRDIRVVRPLGLGLDENAVESVRAWQFKPGTRNGTAVDVLVNEEVFFRPQRTLWDWHVVRAVFHPPGGATRPVLVKTRFPATVDAEENASVTIRFDVGPDGIPADVRVVKSSDAKWERELLVAVREGWRFRPGAAGDKAPGAASDKAPGAASDKAPGAASDKAPGGIAGKAPGGIADKVPGGTPAVVPAWFEFVRGSHSPIPPMPIPPP